MPDGAEGEKDGVVHREGGLRVQVQRGTYKLMYERGGEDVVYRRRGREGARALSERAGGWEEERRRLFWRGVGR